jgi:hypothetical protein
LWYTSSRPSPVEDPSANRTEPSTDGAEGGGFGEDGAAGRSGGGGEVIGSDVPQ